MKSFFSSNEGEYNIKMFAFDKDVTLQAELPVTVADIPCEMPDVSISDASTIPKLPKKHLRAFIFSLQGNSVVKCSEFISSS